MNLIFKAKLHTTQICLCWSFFAAFCNSVLKHNQSTSSRSSTLEFVAPHLKCQVPLWYLRTQYFSESSSVRPVRLFHFFSREMYCEAARSQLWSPYQRIATRPINRSNCNLLLDRAGNLSDRMRKPSITVTVIFTKNVCVYIYRERQWVNHISLW